MSYVFEDSIGRLCRQTASGIGYLINRAFVAKGMEYDSKDWMFISFIKHSDNISQRELAELVGFNKVMVNRVLGKLEARNIILRTKDKADSRIKRLALTPDGIKLYVTMKKMVEQVTNRIFDGIQDQEKDQSLLFLGKVLANIKEVKG